MNTKSTVEQMQEMKLFGMSRRYETVLSLPIHEHTEPHAMVAMLTESELQYRSHKRTARNLGRSKLRYNALPEQIHCSTDRGLTKEQLLMLCDGSYIERGENILINGATGCGKSFLACALGRQACLTDARTLYYTMSRLIETISSARLDGTYARWMSKVAKTHLLIIDDFGISPLDNNIRLTLLDILEDRYGKYPVIITSQLPFNKWHEYIAEATLADAILDRLTAHAHKITLKGPSKRREK